MYKAAAKLLIVVFVDNDKMLTSRTIAIIASNIDDHGTALFARRNQQI